MEYWQNNEWVYVIPVKHEPITIITQFIIPHVIRMKNDGLEWTWKLVEYAPKCSVVQLQHWRFDKAEMSGQDWDARGQQYTHQFRLQDLCRPTEGQSLNFIQNTFWCFVCDVSLHVSKRHSCMDAGIILVWRGVIAGIVTKVWTLTVGLICRLL